MKEFEIEVETVKRWTTRGKTDAPWDDVYNEDKEHRRLAVWAKNIRRALDLAESHDFGENIEVVCVLRVALAHDYADGNEFERAEEV